MITVNWGFLKPAGRQLEEMRQQITSLEKTVAKLSKKHGAASEAMNLLDVLSKQSNINKSATDSLARIADLHNRLVAEAGNLQAAHEAIGEFGKIRDSVATNSRMLKQASLTLQSTAALQQDLLVQANGLENAENALHHLSSFRVRMIRAVDQLVDAEPIVEEVATLHRQMCDLAVSTEEASAVADDVRYLNDSLAAEGASVGRAEVVLNDLIRMRTRIDSEATDVARTHQRLDRLVDLKDAVLAEPGTELAQEKLDELVALKDTVLANASTTPEAIEAIEQTIDLNEQFQTAARSFKHIRRWMTEVVMMEPTIQRAMRTLEPITELGSLRRMSRDELKQVARTLRERQASQIDSLNNNLDITEIADNRTDDETR